MGRLPWDLYFLGMCEAASQRSIDAETQVGAVIVDENRRIVRTGYNAFPAGVDDEFWPRDRSTTVKVPAVKVTRQYGSRGDSEPRTARNLVDVWERTPGLFYEVDKYMAMTHAELNAVVAAGQDLHGCTLYTLLFPCHECAKAIITAGIRRVVFEATREDRSWAVAKELFIQAKVTLDEVHRDP